MTSSHAASALVSLAALALVFAGLGCDASHMRGDDAGRGDAAVTADAGCAGSPALICVSSCGSDAGLGPICEGGRYVCPRGTVDLSSCPPFCMGAPPGPDCLCEPPRWVCPPHGPEVCPIDLEGSLGLPCWLEGQTCGDPCCEVTLSCEDGAWAPGPIADCLTCDESQYFPCGSGRCGAGQACAVGCGPDDGPEYRCVALPDRGCTSCDCAVVPAGGSCEVLDGHLHVGDGGRCG